MLDVEGFILVGGASTRMGADKSELILGGRSTVSIIMDALGPVTRRVRLVGAYGEPPNKSDNISDLHKQWGPLGGIHAALQAASADFCLIVACDLPFVTSDLFALLLELTTDDETAFDAVVPIQEDHRPQPLCAVYRRETCLPASEATIARGEHTPRALLAEIKTRYVDFKDLGALKGAEHFFFNLNRPEDYERAKALDEQR